MFLLIFCETDGTAGGEAGDGPLWPNPMEPDVDLRAVSFALLAEDDIVNSFCLVPFFLSAQ